MLQILIAIFFYALTSLSVFWEPLIDKFGSIQWDAVSVHFYNLFFSSETWNKGIFPLWSPYIFNGFPQIADLQVAFFYPVNLLISAFAVFTPELLMYQIILHYFLAGCFAFLLARYLSNNFWFSVGAGLVYAFGGFMTGHASHAGMQNAAAWLPLIFLFLFLALEKKKIFYSALAGLFFGTAILAGHFQISLYIAFAISFCCLFNIIWLTAESFKKIDKKYFIETISKIKLVSFIFIIAFLISAIQLLPTYELVRQSNRAKISLEMSQTESLNPKNLKALIESDYNNVSTGAPYLGPWDRTQNYLFIGYAMIILAAFGIIFSLFYNENRKMTFFWLALLILSLLYSLGEFGFLQKYFYRFAPFFDKIRAPANMMVLFNISIIGLASSFFNIIHRRFQAFNYAAFIGDRRPRLFVLGKVCLKNISALIGLAAFSLISMEIIPAVGESNTLLYSRQKTSAVTAAPPIAGRIAQEYSHLDEIDKFKIFKIPGLDYNLSQIYHFLAFDGYNPLSLKRHSNYIDAMVKNENLIDMASIKYLPCEFISGRADNLEKIGNLCVNNNFFKRAFFVSSYAIALNENDALLKIQKENLKKVVILEENPEQNNIIENSPNDILSDEAENILITQFRPGLWRFRVKNEKNAFLFISQSNYPGWSAKIDGIDTKIYQADYLFQAIFVPRGDHEIIIKYESKPLINGLILTIIGLSLIAFISLYTKFKKIHP